MAGVARTLPASLQDLAAAARRDVTAARQGWILSVMDRCGPAVTVMLWRMLNNEQDVLDAYQDCVCRMIERGRDGVGRRPEAYFYRMATNSAIDLIRRRKLHHEHEEPLARHRAMRASGPPTDQTEAVAALRRAIVALPDHLRDVVLLHDLAQMPYSQVASIVGITVGSARVYRCKAVMLLADWLDGTEVSQ